MCLPDCIPPVVAMWPEVICPLGEREKKKNEENNKRIWYSIVVEVFLELHLRIDNT